MYGGVILALIVVSNQAGGWDSITNNLDKQSYLNPVGIGWPKVSSWIIASVLGACTAQAGIQPILAAKDIHVARKAALLTAGIVAPFGLLTVFLGMYAKVLFPELSNAKLALPTLMMALHPAVGGIVLASIFAAILSTISPIILASGTMFTKDIYARYHTNINDLDDPKLLKVSRIATGSAGIICIAAAILMYGSTKILDIVYFAYTIRGSLFIILLFGIFWKKTSEKGSIYAMVTTGFVGLFWIIWRNQTGTYPLFPWLTETYAAVIAATVAVYIYSLMFKVKISNAQL